MEINEAEVRAAIEKAFQAIQSGQPVAGVEIPSLKEVLHDSEYFADVSVNVDTGRAQIFSTVHHDTDLVYEADTAGFNLDDAARAMVEDIKAGIEQFDEMFPE